MGYMTVLRALRDARLAPRLLASPSGEGGSASYVYQLPALLPQHESAELFDYFCNRFDGWKTESDAFGRQQRATAYFGEDGAIFSYVGLTCRPKPWPTALANARKRAELVASAHGTQVTACLANHYSAGGDSIPWHSGKCQPSNSGP